MSMIGIGGEKGGCGKTTFAVHVAAYLANKGASVAILDADKKPHAHEWAVRRMMQEGVPQIDSKRASGEIDDTINAMRDRYDHVIIDCGGMASIEMKYAIAMGDIFIAPFNTSYFDTDTAVDVNHTIKHGKVLNPKLEAYCVLVSCVNHRNSKSKAQARERLHELTAMKLLDGCTHTLEVYRQTIKDGLSALDPKVSGAAKAKVDMRMIMEEMGL